MSAAFDFSEVLGNPETPLEKLLDAGRIADGRLMAAENEVLACQSKLLAGGFDASSDLEEAKAELSSARNLSKTINGLISFRNSRSEIRAAARDK